MELDVTYEKGRTYCIFVEIGKCEHGIKLEQAKRLYDNLGKVLQQADSADAKELEACVNFVMDTSFGGE